MKVLGYLGLVGVVVFSSLVLMAAKVNPSVPETVVQVNTTTVPNVVTNPIQINNQLQIQLLKKNVSLLNLKSDNTVVLEGPIDSTNAPMIAKAITKAASNNPSVYLLINSPGGSVLDGASIISAIEASKVPVNTVCMQLCASMAAIIHQYGTHRYSIDRSILMFHPASGGVQGTLEQMSSRLGQITSYVNKFNAYIAQRSGHDYKEFKNQTLTELWIDAEDSLQQHYTDKIVYLNLEDNALLPLVGAAADSKHLSLPLFSLDWY